jgi:hypothetical protein
MTSRVGIFTRCDKPLRWNVRCEVCANWLGVPFYFCVTARRGYPHDTTTVAGEQQHASPQDLT